RSFYNECDIFVAPSRYESFGLVFLEAMVFGKPVIAGDAGGGPEVVTHEKSGLLVPPGDAGALGAALNRLLADPGLRIRLGQNARRDYETRFTDAVMVRDFLAAFTRMGIRAEPDVTSRNRPATNETNNVRLMALRA
ncbi:MAG: glycosyltransferase, partial [Proteobacteria bacterium]